MALALRITALLLALPLLLAGAGGFWLSSAEEQSRRQVEVVLRSRLPLAAGVVLANSARLGATPVWGGALAGAALLFGLALRPRRTPLEPRVQRHAARGNPAGKQAAPAQRGAGPPQRGVSRGEARRLLKRAGALAAAQGPAAAGDLLLGHGLRDEAARIFSDAGLLDRVAEIRHDQNRFDESAELYEKAGQFAAAGAIYAQRERFADAARCYLAADKRSVAGEMYERAGQFAEAGRCYYEIGFHRHAANAFLKANRNDDAARALLAVLEEEGALLRGENEQVLRDLRAIAQKAGKLLAGLGRLAEAESVLVKASLYAQAARVALAAGEPARAAELYLRAGSPDQAAEALERAGDVAGAARVRGESLRERGDDVGAVRYLLEAGEFQDAGDLYRKLQRYPEAAECYLRVKDFAGAAEMFEGAEQWERACEAWASGDQLVRAAECAEKAGDPLRRAALLEQAGLGFEAGRAYIANDQKDEAIRVLQQVPAEDASYRPACALLGGLFREKGMHSLSIAKLEQAAGGEAVSRANVEAYYALANEVEARELFARAAELYEQILAFDFHYADVAARLERTKAAARRATEPAEGATGLPAAARGRYRLLNELGRGGMGVVYLARDTVLDRDVAYKVLPLELRNNPNALKNFLREAKAAAQLNHPHIVTVYDAGESEHGFYLAMEYVDGTTLKEILRRKGVLPPSGVVYVVRQTADALGFAHSKKVVHRDVKTANTMWTADKQVKVMDFGLAKLMEEVRNATTLVSGTPFYMSPEQTLGRNVDHRTDLYSLGVTAFELATGTLPFRKGNVPYHHVHTPPPDPRSVNPRVPDELAALILRCLQKDPDDRYQSAAEILRELDSMAARIQQA